MILLEAVLYIDLIWLGVWNPLACLKVHKTTKKLGFTFSRI